MSLVLVSSRRIEPTGQVAQDATPHLNL